MREIGSIPGGTIGAGGRASVSFVPQSLSPFYGTRTPVGLAVDVRVRPKRMAMEHGAMEMTGHGQQQMQQQMPMPTPRTPQPPMAHDSMPGMSGMPMHRDSAAAHDIVWSGQYEYMQRAQEKMKLLTLVVIPAVYSLWREREVARHRGESTDAAAVRTRPHGRPLVRRGRATSRSRPRP